MWTWFLSLICIVVMAWSICVKSRGEWFIVMLFINLYWSCPLSEPINKRSFSVLFLVRSWNSVHHLIMLHIVGQMNHPTDPPDPRCEGVSHDARNFSFETWGMCAASPLDHYFSSFWESGSPLLLATSEAATPPKGRGSRGSARQTLLQGPGQREVVATVGSQLF